MTEQLSSWQRLKLKRKTGERKKQIENHFRISSVVEDARQNIKTKPEFKRVEGKSTATLDLDEERYRRNQERVSKQKKKFK